jgi:mannose-6-phosphate isomerase-like protein (cupin superfamily)
MKPLLVTHEQAIAQLQKEKNCVFTELMQHGTMKVEYFSPKITGTQQPHSQDELYVIACGNSKFFRNGETVACKTGDVLFVPARMVHYFTEFSDDFATWVIFYGPLGGEKNNQC